MSSLEEQSIRNIALWHRSALRSIGERGRWPSELSIHERKALCRDGLVDLSFRKNQLGKQPRLTDLAVALISAVL